jgi:hypothetical protein
VGPRLTGCGAGKAIKSAKAYEPVVSFDLVPPMLLGVLDAVPPIIVTILIIVVIIFVIKSLLKFAIIVGAIALIIFVAWRMHWIPGFS